MKNSSRQIDRTILKTLEPLNRLNPLLLDELAAKSIIDEVPAGRIICRHGEKDARQIYLLSGQIEIATQGNTKVNVVKSKSPLKTPVAEGSPRNVTLKTKTDSTLLYIDADLLELLMSDEPELTAAYEVTEIDTDSGDDWMLTFLQSPAFLQLPTENIQQLLTHMEEVHVKKGQVVIKQDGKDDNYYIIKSGSCNVHRKPYKDAADVLLAVLPTGSGFGEEALITNGSRNATITMRENGALMRLKKKDFLKLLVNPLITYFEQSQTKKKLDEGCVVIDVRTELQSKQQPLEGAVNIPLSLLRLKFESLNTDREYLLVCDDGSQSAAAAFLMIQHGMKCSVLKGGMKNVQAKTDITVTKTAAITTPDKKADITELANKQAAEANKQAKQVAAQQQQIKEARLKTEQDILKHKKELAETRARIIQQNQQLSSAQTEAALMKDKAAKELIKAQAESQAIERRQKETNEAMQRVEDMMKQSATATELARKQAEEEASTIKRRALEEVEYLRAEVEAARQKMEQDSARLKQEEEIIKQSALQMRNEADEIRRAAMDEAQQVRAEIESTRALLHKKLQQTQDEEKRKHDAILAQAKKRADELAATKTQQAMAEADAIRLKAQEDATRLHNELEETRKQIEAEAARVISELKEQSKQAVIQSSAPIVPPNVPVIEEVIEVVSDTRPISKIKAVEESVDYKTVSIPGFAAIEQIDDKEAQRKAKAIKDKLTQAQTKQAAEKHASESLQSMVQTKVHKKNDKTILEGEEDLFIFKTPDYAPKVNKVNSEQASVSTQKNPAQSALTQISTAAQTSKVVFQKQEHETVYENNPFLYKEETKTSGMNYANNQRSGNRNDLGHTKNAQPFNKDAYMRNHQTTKSNTLAIAASFIMILAGAVFTLHATDTLKVQAIAALFNSGNDIVQPAKTSIAKTKTIRKKVLRADTKVNVKQKVESKMDNIMQGWKDVLEESKNPKKSQNNQ